MLLQYLKQNRSIMPFEALNILGIYRLAARIYDLRDFGHDIHTTKVEVTNNRGDVCLVARYTLMDTNNVAA